MSTESQVLVQASGLIKHYPLKAGGLVHSRELVHALNGVSFDLEAHKTLGLVGESGCGKTTTGKLLLRLIEPEGGRLFFDVDPAQVLRLKELEAQLTAETDPRRHRKLESDLQALARRTDFFAYPPSLMKRERLKMQHVFQDPAASLDPKMQVREIVTENLVVGGRLGRGEIDREAARLLDIVGISREGGRKYPHEFSGGQRQRISIARAIAGRPRLVVCDEPVSSLDVSIQSQILNLLLDLQKELGISYLFISHNLAVVFYMSDEVAVMYAGRIVEQASARELYRLPLHPYTRLLISVTPELGKGKKIYAERIEGEPPSLIHVPPGCTFFDRCPARLDICRDSFPPLEARENGLRSGHLCACWAVPAHS